MCIYLIGKLWCKGMRIDWSKVSGDASLKRIVLPTYVFDKKEFDSDVLFGGHQCLIRQQADRFCTRE